MRLTDELLLVTWSAARQTMMKMLSRCSSSRMISPTVRGLPISKYVAAQPARGRTTVERSEPAYGRYHFTSAQLMCETFFD